MIEGVKPDESFDGAENLRKVIARALTLAPDRTGGYFCMADKESGLPLLIMAVGEMPEEKAVKYFSFAQEKAVRLSKNPGHYSSWQSRNPDQFQYGGAILGREFIFSFSGFPEALDEAAMLVLAILGEQIDSDTATLIARASQNEFFWKLQSERIAQLQE